MYSLCWGSYIIHLILPQTLLFTDEETDVEDTE